VATHLQEGTALSVRLVGSSPPERSDLIYNTRLKGCGGKIKLPTLFKKREIVSTIRLDGTDGLLEACLRVLVRWKKSDDSPLVVCVTRVNQKNAYLINHGNDQPTSTLTVTHTHTPPGASGLFLPTPFQSVWQTSFPLARSEIVGGVGGGWGGGWLSPVVTVVRVLTVIVAAVVTVVAVATVATVLTVICGPGG
jgi:hypothetical protein